MRYQPIPSTSRGEAEQCLRELGWSHIHKHAKVVRLSDGRYVYRLRDNQILTHYVAHDGVLELFTASAYYEETGDDSFLEKEPPWAALEQLPYIFLVLIAVWMLFVMLLSL